jgi:hypothetical protein
LAMADLTKAELAVDLALADLVVTVLPRNAMA